MRNLTIWKNAAVISTGSPSGADPNRPGYLYRFHLGVPLTVPHGNFVTLLLKADVLSFFTGSVVDGSISQFEIPDGSMVNAVTTSGVPVVVGGFAFGRSMRILRGEPSITSVSGGPTEGIITLSAGQGSVIILSKLTVTFVYEPAPKTLIPLANIHLIDQNGNDLTAIGAAVKLPGVNAITWLFTNGFVMPAGESVSFQIRAPWPLLMSIQSSSDLIFADGFTPNATPGLSLPARGFPIYINGQSAAK
jgi:hypothetical protein